MVFGYLSSMRKISLPLMLLLLLFNSRTCNYFMTLKAMVTMWKYLGIKSLYYLTWLGYLSS